MRRPDRMLRLSGPLSARFLPRRRARRLPPVALALPAAAGRMHAPSTHPAPHVRGSRSVRGAARTRPMPCLVADPTSYPHMHTPTISLEHAVGSVYSHKRNTAVRLEYTNRERQKQ